MALPVPSGSSFAAVFLSRGSELVGSPMQGVGKPLAAIGLPGRLLEGLEDELRDCGRNAVSLVAKLNLLLQSWSVNLRVKVPCQSLEDELRALTRRVKRSVGSARGGSGIRAIRERLFKVHLKNEYLPDPHSMARELEAAHALNEQLEEEAEALMTIMQEEMAGTERELRAEVNLERDVNHQLKEHIDGLFRRESAFHGKSVGDCRERAARYKLSALRNRAQLALAVAQQIGLDVESLIIRDLNTGQHAQLKLDETAQGVGLPSAQSMVCSKTTTGDTTMPNAPRLETAMASRAEENTQKTGSLRSCLS